MVLARIAALVGFAKVAEVLTPMGANLNLEQTRPLMGRTNAEITELLFEPHSGAGCGSRMDDQAGDKDSIRFCRKALPGKEKAGMTEYAGILATMGGYTLGWLTSIDASWNSISLVGGIIFLFWLVVFKLH